MDEPLRAGALIGGVAVLVGFVVIEHHVDDPMFQLHLFRSRSFAMGNLAGLMAALARGGLQFILIIWLQGIWLPLHGYSFERTPLWAGIYMIPLTVGFFISGPLAGRLADRYGPRPFATRRPGAERAGPPRPPGPPHELPLPAVRRCCSCWSDSPSACSPPPTPVR